MNVVALVDITTLWNYENTMTESRHTHVVILIG